MHSFANSGKPDDALEVFDEISSGQFGTNVVPQEACFNGKILALLRKKAWAEASETRTEMESLGVKPDATTLQGWMVACQKLNDNTTAIDVLNEAVRSRTPLDASCFKQALKCLAPEAIKGTKSLQDVRTKLRLLSDELTKQQQEKPGSGNEPLQKRYLGLTRAMWSALIEEDRQPSKNLRMDDIERRRRKGWEAAVRALIDLANEKENGSGS